MELTTINSGEVDGGFLHPRFEISKFDFGPKIGVDFELNKKTSLDIDYYHGIKNINDNWIGHNFELSNKQLTLGIEYYLIKTIANTSS